MIGYLHGTLLLADKNNILINVNNVGYRVSCAEQIYVSLNIGDEITLYTETVWRENDVTIYGFKTPLDCEWFRLLCTVQGVGAKMAMVMISHFNTHNLTSMIATQDKTSLTAASGVGQKIAERIIRELRDKLPNRIDDGGASTGTKHIGDEFNEALSGLVNLGFARHIAQACLIDIQKQHKNIKTDEVLRLALQALNKDKR